MKTGLWIVLGLVVLVVLYWWWSARTLTASRPSYSSSSTGGTSGLLDSLINGGNQVKRLVDTVFGKPAAPAGGAITPDSFEWAA